MVQDRGRLFDLGQVDDREVVVAVGCGVDREGGVDEDPFAIGGVLVVRDRWAARSQPGTVE